YTARLARRDRRGRAARCTRRGGDRDAGQPRERAPRRAVARRPPSRRPRVGVIVEIFVLALASTIRPTSLAAVYALLSPDSRRGLMCAYVAAGPAFTVGFGLLVVYAFHGFHVRVGDDRTKGIADIAGGVIAIGFGLAVLKGRVGVRRNHDAPDAARR